MKMAHRLCIPCLVLPAWLWLLHNVLKPYIFKLLNPWLAQKTMNEKATHLLVKDQDLDSSNQSYQHILELTRAHPVLVFSKTTCCFCQLAKGIMDSAAISYTVEEINKRPDCQQLQDVLLKMTGNRTVPRIFVGGTFIGGGTEVWLLHNENKLLPIMEAVGAAGKKTD